MSVSFCHQLQKISPFLTFEGGSFFILGSALVLHQDGQVGLIASVYLASAALNSAIYQVRKSLKRVVTREDRCLQIVLIINLVIAYLGIVYVTIPLINDEKVF